MAKRMVHPGEVRTAALNAYRAGDTPGQIAASLNVPKSTIHNWLDKEGIKRVGGAPANGSAPASAARVVRPPAAPAAAESDEVRALRAQVRTLQAQVANLKGTIAILAGAA